jgi:hypothetical protein
MRTTAADRSHVFIAEDPARVTAFWPVPTYAEHPGTACVITLESLPEPLIMQEETDARGNAE